MKLVCVIYSTFPDPIAWSGMKLPAVERRCGREVLCLVRVRVSVRVRVRIKG